MGPKRKATKKTKKVTKKTKKKVTRVQAPRQCSEALSRLLSCGAEASLHLTPGQAIKQFWQVARNAKLAEGQTIVCNNAMRCLFGQPQLTMFEVLPALSKHMSAIGARLPPAPPPAPSPNTSSTEPVFMLSPAFTSLLCGGRGDGGNRQMMMTQKEALRRLGGYITKNGLRDEADKRRIHCDGELSRDKNCTL